MSKADVIFKNMCNDILTNGCSTNGEHVRAVWPDTNEKAYTIKKFGVVNRYNLQEEFPAITLRKTAIKSATDEILWIYQKKSSNIHDLNSHIWDEWADSNGSIGKAYGYQIGKRFVHHKYNGYPKDEDININKKEYPSAVVRFMNGTTYVIMDQMDAVLWDLKHDPFSRRIMTNVYDFSDLNEMNLYPCAYSMTYNVTRDKDNKFVLNGILNQRSQDTLVAGNWNVVQYAILLMMVAQSCNMIPGELIHVIADCHIYDRHIPMIKDLLTRKEYSAPAVWLDSSVKNFYDFKPEHVKVANYQTGPQIENIPVGV